MKKNKFLSLLASAAVALSLVVLPTTVDAAFDPITAYASDNSIVVDGIDGMTPVTAPVIGQILCVNIENGTYKWTYEGSDAVLGTDRYYTVTSDNVGKVLTVTVKASDGTEKTWKADKAVTKGTLELHVVDGTDGFTPVTAPVVGQVLCANVNAKDVKYVWSYKGSDTVLGRDKYYTVTSDNIGKTITVKVIAHNGEGTWVAEGTVAMKVLELNVVDGTDGYTPVTAPVVGQVLCANTDAKDVKYVWSYKGSDTVLGTDKYYTVTTDNLGKVLTVTVSAADRGTSVWTANKAVCHTQHTTELISAKDATCIEAGYTGDKICIHCHEVVEEGHVIAPLGHDFVDGECTRCGEEEVIETITLTMKAIVDGKEIEEATTVIKDLVPKGEMFTDEDLELLDEIIKGFEKDYKIDGYVFKGFFLDEKGTEKLKANVPFTEDFTIYMIWDKEVVVTPDPDPEDKPTIPEKPETPDKPADDKVDTGDHSLTSIYMAAMGMAVLAAGVVVINKKKEELSK